MELAPDFIKVDLSLIRGIDTDPPRQELLRALHAVAGKLGGQIIAEGIETSEELETLQGLGIPYGQGYLFGRAAPRRFADPVSDRPTRSTRRGAASRRSPHGGEGRESNPPGSRRRNPHSI